MSATTLPQPGQVVGVRQRLYLVEQSIPARNLGDATLVRLSCVDDDAQGQPLEILWERELDGHILAAEDWKAISQRGFDPPDRFSAYLNTLMWNCVTSTDPNLLQSPFRAGIRLDAYQLEPLRKALRLPRVNLFIADDVGLGKTIEAGLIARELLIRKKVRDIVVACPPSMLLQWQEELDARFGLTFEILDKDYVRQVRRERGFGVNPWTTHSRFLISQALLIDDAYRTPMMSWLDNLRPGSLLILDEAHHAAPASGQRYAIDSQITRAVREIAPLFEHRLFLSATPHNGHSNSFSALLEILDPQRFCRGVKATKGMLESVMVRRLKDDLREIVGGFPKRHTPQVNIRSLPPHTPELRLAALLDEYRRVKEQRLSGETKRVQNASGLLICGLQQRLFSSVEAFARTLAVHRRTVQRHEEHAKKNTPAAIRTDLLSGADLLIRPAGPDDDRALFSEQELAAEEDAQVQAVSEATLGSAETDAARQLFEREQQILNEMTEIAEANRALPDARINKLVEWIRDNMCPGLPARGAQWNETRVIIFTEYEDTRRYLAQQLSAAIAETDRADERIAVFHGPTPPDKREEIKLAFNADPAKHPVRILIATDAAREGLNLQAHCWNLFHFDVPWNPARMEQRNGRIDRKLQPNAEVFCRYFFYHDRPEDRIIAALVKKTKTIREELGSLSQVIDAKVDDLLKTGIRRNEIRVLEQEIESADLDTEMRATVSEELEATRERQTELRRQIERLTTLLASSQKTIDFSQSHFRTAISCALEILGAEPLSAGKDENGLPEWRFPALDQRAGADPTWAATLDSLRQPRKRREKFWDWRRDSPIRPVVFEDPGRVTDELVQFHLEHRVVQRLLSRFTSQGFVHHDLSRACMAQTVDATPRVLLIARLALYGPGAARLHEELIAITARWIDPAIRKEPLSPYGRDREAFTVRLLDRALLEKHARAIPDVVIGQLQAAAPRDIAELLSYVQQRGEEYAREAKGKLEKRAEAESKAMREILDAQKKRLIETAEKWDRNPQLSLQFDENEKRQLDANRRHWAKRLESLDRELETEPERVRAVYEVRAQRIEPVGLVYLWPLTR